MNKRMSEMSNEELYTEMQTLLGESRKKRQAGFISEANMLEQKYFLAKSYHMESAVIIAGETYRVHGEDALFTVKYLNGVFAWGKLTTSEEEVAFPIGRLEAVEASCCSSKACDV